MNFITLTTDMGLQDYYVAALKGAIYSNVPDIKVIDISHNIAPFDIAQASYVLKNCFSTFPKGTIHIIGVNPEQTEDNRHVVVKFEGHYFIGADNGIFSLMFDRHPDEVYEIYSNENEHFSFPSKDVFTKIACHLALGGTPEKVGFPKETIQRRQLFRATEELDVIKGTVSYIDSYGNVLTNIKKTVFEEVGQGRSFKIYLTRAGYTITKICNRYSEVPEGEKVALFSSADYLEIAINKGVQGSGGGANKLFGLKLNDTITIEFD